MRNILCPHRALLRGIAAGIAALTIALTSVAQAPRVESAAERERRILSCFDRGDYAEALTLIDKHLEQSPNDFNMLYNAACAHARLNHGDEAASTLLRSVKAGFRDFLHMRVDPDLESIRTHPTYLAILEASERVAASEARPAVERWKAEHDPNHYRYETDENRRINYATALDKDAHERMRTMLERQSDQLVKTLFENPPDYFILIAIPTPRDSDKFFNGRDEIGGMYEHNQRRLVSRDIGGALWHEFCHALHFGHMERLNQPHPLWIQEGLACLYEDYAIDDDGSIRFLPNERQSIVRNRAKAGILIKWKDLFALTSKRFMAKAQEMYPQVRSIFEFLAAEGKLSEWYSAYTRNFDDDKNGGKALEIVFNKPLSEIERDWRQWIAAQPALDLTIDDGDAALGVSSPPNGSNDGVLVTGLLRDSAASKAGLRRNDVIVAIDDQATPSLIDLQRVVASRRVGDTVSLRIRRKGEYLTLDVTLEPLRGE